jgi:hypothetical protein
MNYEQLLESNKFKFNADATSLYPASMSGFDLCDVSYPIGHSRWSKKPKLEFENKKIGFYEINFKCPKNITVPILPRKKFNNVFVGSDNEKSVNIGVEWSLYDGTGVYTSVDITNAINAGYEVEFINECLVYDKSGDVFSKYINLFYKMKDDAEKECNAVKRSVAKLFLNSLYGKTLQKAIFSTTEIINNVHEFDLFITHHTITDFQEMGQKLLLTGDKKDKAMQITKPCQLGAFVTAYSRRIMLVYILAIDPTLKSNIFSYTDTDCLHIDGTAYKHLLNKNMIRTKQNSALGYLCSDIDGEGIIISEVNLAPKTYKYDYINNKNIVSVSDKN